MTPNIVVQNETGSARAALVFARLMGLLAAGFGVAVTVGWYMEGPLLMQGFSSSLTIAPNAAAGFLLAGLGLLSLTYRVTRPLARLLGLVLMFGTVAILNQSMVDMKFDVANLLYGDSLRQKGFVPYHELSPGAVMAFFLIGCVLLLTARRAWIFVFHVEIMLVAVLIMVITNLIGHSYEITQLYNPFPFTAMPVHMGILIALTAAGLSAACPDRGFARALLDTSAGGQMIRRLLPGIIFIPILLGWIVHRGLMKNIYSNAVGTAFFAVSTIVVMAGFIWMTSVALRRSDRERQEALIELHGQRESLRTTLASIADAVMATERGGSVIVMNPVAERLTGWSIDEARLSTISEVFRIVDEETYEPVQDPAAAAQRENRVIALADCALIRKDETSVPVEYISSPILDTNGKVAGAVLIFRDITERRRAEEQQEMVVSELNHRVRNVLMIVQSMVQASAQHTGGKSAEEMSRVLAERFQSLSRAHELLLDTHWTGASLKRMVELELDPFRQSNAHKIALRGRDVLLPPQCTSVVAMALHELTTNAAKYGALAHPGGQLNVSWTTKRSTLTINWLESNFEMPERRKAGFGMRLIDKGIRQNLGGDTKLEFTDDGLTVTMQIPISDPAPKKRQRTGQKQMT